MKWQVIDKKHNSAKNITQEYNITLETTEKNNIVEVKVTVPVCPRGQRPVTWHATNVLNWLQQKGYDVVDALQTETLTDATAQTGTYSFSLKQKQNKTKQSRTSKTKKNSTKSSLTPRTTTTANVVTSNLNTDVE